MEKPSEQLINDQREAVVIEALSWDGTPYHHKACVKGHGVDCAMLLAGTFTNVELVRNLNIPDYSPYWHQHQNEEIFLNILRQYADEMVPGTDKLPGDIVVFLFGRTYSHGAIVLNWPRIMHAHQKSGIVHQGDIEIDGDLQGRPFKHFRYKGWA